LTEGTDEIALDLRFGSDASATPPRTIWSSFRASERQVENVARRAGRQIFFWAERPATAVYCGGTRKRLGSAFSPKHRPRRCARFGTAFGQV
jgi:hypothetical protein